MMLYAFLVVNIVITLGPDTAGRVGRTRVKKTKEKHRTLREVVPRSTRLMSRQYIVYIGQTRLYTYSSYICVCIYWDL